MSVVFSDNFNRASLGTNWSSRAPGGGSVAIAGSATLRCAFGGSTAPAYGYTNTGAHSALADMLVTATRITGTGWDGGPMVRVSSTADTGYYLDVVAGASSHDVYRRVAGTDTLVASRSFTSAANDVLGLQIQGTTLKIFKGGVQQGANLTDSGISAAGFGGCLSWDGGAGEDFDDFSVDDLTVAGGSIYASMLTLLGVG